MRVEMYCPKILVVLALLVGTSAAFGQAIPNTFFNQTVTTTDHGEPFPSTYVNGIRLWCTGTAWADLNPSDGVYDFTKLDVWLQEAAQQNLDVLYTFARVPDWASSDPKLYCNSRVDRGECAPPNDLNADGSGSDQHWKDFVTAIVAHSVNSNIAHINHWEIWNEPNTLGNWQGTTAQLVRMTADASAIIKSMAPSTTVNSPAPSGEWGLAHGLSAVAAWMQDFLKAGGGSYLDVVDFHSYVWELDKPPIAEQVVPLIENLKQVLVTQGVGNLPIWSSEGSYGERRNGEYGTDDPDLQAAFTARYLLLQSSEGLARFFWFSWDGAADENGIGTLWSPQEVSGCNTPNQGGGYLCKPGLAYEQVAEWMKGAAFDHTCAQQRNSQLWSCIFKRPKHYRSQVIWNPSKSCSGGHCETVQVQVGSQYIQYRDLGGHTHVIKNHSVPVGAKPILAENQSQ